MRLLYTDIQNFLSFGAPPQRVELQDQGLVCVLGSNKDSSGADSNGSGKSTVLEAIVWCLYGETMRRYRGDDVVHRKAGKDCKVSLAIEDGDHTYLVTRTRKMSGQKKPNELFLAVNGSPVTQGVNKDTQEMVTTIIGMDFSTFTQSVMMWHDIANRPFSQLNDKDQKAVLEDILQIDKLTKAHRAAKDKVQLLENSLALSQASITSLDREIYDCDVLIGKYTEKQNQYKTLQDQRVLAILSKKAAVQLRLDALYAETKLDKLLELHDNLVNESSRVELSRKRVQDARLEISRKFADKRAIVARTEGAAHGRLSKISQDIQTFDKLAGKPCTLCQQNLSVEAAELCVREWEAEAHQLRTRTLAAVESAAKELDRDEEHELLQLVEEESRIEAEWSSAQAAARSAIDQIKCREASLSLIDQLERQVWSLREEVNAVKEEVSPFGTLLSDIQETRRASIAEKKTTSYSVRGTQVELDHLNYWIKGFSNKGLKSYLLENVVPFLTARAQEYADIVSGGDITLEFSTKTELKSGETREKFQIVAKNRNGADVYHGNSVGEKRRIDLAVGWALADLASTRSSKPIKFRALDEPFESLDFTGEELVVKLLHQVISRFETIVVITHSDHLSSHFTNKMVVEKHNGYTTLVN